VGIFDRFGARSRGPTEIRDAEVIPSEDQGDRALQPLEARRDPRLR
jgi:hypothetical protein